MEHSYPYSEHTESQLLEFLEDEVLKFAEITTHEFLSLGCAGTFRWLGYYKKHSYSVFSGRENTDYYVRQALKLYDFAYFKKLHGFTRKPKLGCALSRFLHFARPVHTKKQGFIDDFSPEESEWLNICYENAQVACGHYLFGNKINNGFKPLSSFHEAVDSLPTNTSAGFSYPGKKKGEVKNLARRKATLMHDLITHGHKVTKVPSTIALRGHLSPVDQLKSRTIILYPYEVQILEAKLYKPLYTQMKKVSPIISGDQSLQRLHSYLHLNPSYTFINTDISGWDRMRSIFLIRDAFKVLNSYMDFSSQDKLVAKWLADYLINTPIMLPDGNLFRKKGGIPSGTFLTLLINSACNYIAQHTLLNYLNIRYYDLSVLGDDCAFFMSEGQTWNSIFSEFCRLNMKVFALRMNEEKSVATDNLTDRKFIGYQFKGLELYRDTDEFFKAALYPESDVKNVAISFSRLFSYLCIGGINDSKFFSFFEFFCTSYQDSLRLFKRELFKEKVFRFGSLRVFKDMLNFRIEDVINLDFDSFLNLDWYAVRWMFSLNVSIQKKDVNYFVDDN